MIYKQELSPQNGRYTPLLFFHLAPNQSEECLIRFPGWERATTSVKKLSRKSAQSLGSQWSQFLSKKAKFEINFTKSVKKLLRKSAQSLVHDGAMAILKAFDFRFSIYCYSFCFRHWSPLFNFDCFPHCSGIIVYFLIGI